MTKSYNKDLRVRARGQNNSLKNVVQNVYFQMQNIWQNSHRTIFQLKFKNLEKYFQLFTHGESIQISSSIHRCSYKKPYNQDLHGTKDTDYLSTLDKDST